MTTPTVFRERRQLADRRARPTSFWSAFRFHGRRRGFRRAHEGRNAYVDCPAPRVTLLVIFTALCSVLDALFTLLHLGYGGSEANPIMAWALSQSTTLFVILKMGTTGICTWFLAILQQFRMAFIALHGLAFLYFLILVIHSLLLFS